MTWKCDGLLYLLSTTSSTASSSDTEFTKEDEQRLKDYIQQLKNDRAAVKLTMLELESVHIDPLSYDVKPRGDSQRLDLENAVLMQELMAMKVSMGGPGGGVLLSNPVPSLSTIITRKYTKVPAHGSADEKSPPPMLSCLSLEESQSLICRQGQFHLGWTCFWRGELNAQDAQF